MRRSRALSGAIGRPVALRRAVAPVGVVVLLGSLLGTNAAAQAHGLPELSVTPSVTATNANGVATQIFRVTVQAG